MPTHLGDASKEVNDTHGRRRRRLQPNMSRIFIQTVAHLPPLTSDLAKQSMRGHTAAATAPYRHDRTVAEHRPLARPGARRPTSSSYTVEEEAPEPPPLQLRQDQPVSGRAGHATPGSQQPAELRLRPRSTHAHTHQSSPCRETLDRAPRSSHAATSSLRRSLPPPRRRQQEAHRAPRPPQRLQAQAKIYCRRGPSAPQPPTPRRCPEQAAAPHLSTALFLSPCSPPCAATPETSTAPPARRRPVGARHPLLPPLTAGRRHHRRRRRPGNHGEEGCSGRLGFRLQGRPRERPGRERGKS